MGMTPTEALLAGVPDGRPYTAPEGPYRGAPRGRPNSGLNQSYQPTGRPRVSGYRYRSVGLMALMP